MAGRCYGCGHKKSGLMIAKATLLSLKGSKRHEPALSLSRLVGLQGRAWRRLGIFSMIFARCGLHVNARITLYQSIIRGGHTSPTFVEWLTRKPVTFAAAFA